VTLQPVNDSKFYVPISDVQLPSHPLAVEHFLIQCVNFAAIRSRYFSASSMKDVFENVDAQSVIDFVKEIQFYHEL